MLKPDSFPAIGRPRR